MREMLRAKLALEFLGLLLAIRPRNNAAILVRSVHLVAMQAEHL